MPRQILENLNLTPAATAKAIATADAVGWFRAQSTKLRENRLALLGDLHALMNKVADLSKLAA